VIFHQIVTVDPRIHFRDGLQRVNHGLDKERHEAKLHSVPLLEGLLVL